MNKINYLIILIMILLTSCLTPKVDKKEEPLSNEKEVITEAEEPISVVEEIVENPDSYEVSNEEYDKTFEEIEVFITNLNQIISSNNFVKWQTYLSDTYISKYGDTEYLEKLSDNQVLKDYGIKLRKLRDYFNYVVVPSRSNVVIDEIQFISEDKIKAFTFTNNDKFLVYLLVRTDAGWIISD